MKDSKAISPFAAEIAHAEKQLRKAQKAMDAVKLRHDAGDILAAYLEAFNFSDAAERLALTARQMPAYTGHPQAQKTIATHLSDNLPIRMGFTPEGWFAVVIPALLPKKLKGSADFIREAMYQALGLFFRGKEPVRYTDCVMIFRHVYRRDRPERQYRDHDNIEVNAVSDTVALYVLFDDSPLRCSHFYCSAPGSENRTEIFIVPQTEFEKWIYNAKSYFGAEIRLLENHP